jgi:hypothetical protein
MPQAAVRMCARKLPSISSMEHHNFYGDIIGTPFIAAFFEAN